MIGGSDAPIEYNNAAELSSDVSVEMNAKAIALDVGYSVDSVDCINLEGREFTCHVGYSDGDSATLSVTVSADGQTWISHGQ